MKVIVKVLCLATYTDVVDVPNEVEDIEEYLNEHLSEFDVSNLEYADDIENGVQAYWNAEVEK